MIQLCNRRTRDLWTRRKLSFELMTGAIGLCCVLIHCMTFSSVEMLLMGRRSAVKLAFIANRAARKATYKKRKAGLLKKLGELQVLCGIEVCCVIFSDFEPELVVWPNLKDANRVIDRFMDTPNTKRNTHSLDQVTFLKESMAKLEGELKRLRMKNQRTRTMLLLRKFMTGEEITFPGNIEELNMLREDIVVLLGDIRGVEASKDLALPSSRMQE
ncbi:hypothetical protein Droror1_Dr00000727 [Drosera rotundifolia]